MNNVQPVSKNNLRMKEKNGFSLLEILIAGTVLAVVLVGLAMLMSYTTKSDSQARTRTFASEIAQSQVDFFRQERSILSWGGLRSILSDGKYCLNGVTGFSTSVENNILEDLEFTEEIACPYVSVSDDIPVLIRQVAEVQMDDDGINVEIIVSWQNDAQNRVISVSSKFQLKKDTH